MRDDEFGTSYRWLIRSLDDPKHDASAAFDGDVKTCRGNVSMKHNDGLNVL